MGQVTIIYIKTYIKDIHVRTQFPPPPTDNSFEFEQLDCRWHTRFQVPTAFTYRHDITHWPGFTYRHTYKQNLPVLVVA